MRTTHHKASRLHGCAVAVVALASVFGACAPRAVAPEVATGAPEERSAAEQDADRLVAEITSRLVPLEKAASTAWYEASTTGTAEAFARSEAAHNALDAAYSDPQLFAQVKALREGEGICDPVLKRQLDVLYKTMLGKQVQPDLLRRITAMQTQLEQAFNTYRGTVNGEAKTDNELRQILRTATDEDRLRQAWEAQKSVGEVVAGPLRELVALRNQVAHQLGFRDYYALALATAEQDETELLALFDELDELTREPFLELKRMVDNRLSRKLGIAVEQLRPWHYQNPFFQEPPDVFEGNLDELYKGQDTLELCRRFYTSINLEVADILARSDLYEKDGKSPHAYSVDLDRDQDVRVLANIVPGAQWQSTMSHELGHAVYDKYKDLDMPWLLRTAAHPLTTEGVALMMESVVHNPRWAEAMKLLSAADRERIAPEARLKSAFFSLVFSRWTQVMLRFEKALYADPEQDLNALWWSLVQKYQAVVPPEERDAPDYASKIHFVIAPVYYHNYMLGSLFSAQLHETLSAQTQGEPLENVYVGDARIGAFLRDRVFSAGARYPWHELIERATGKPLSAEAFARHVSVQGVSKPTGPVVD